MTDTSAEETTERVPLNLRVDETVLHRFNEKVIEKYGNRQPYVGVELERELRHLFDTGAASRLWELVDELLGALGIPRGRKNSSRGVDRDGSSTTVVRCRVNGDLRERLIEFADGGDRTAGEVVEDAMRRYYSDDGGSVVERVADRVERILSVADDELGDDGSATERRRDTIAAVVGEGRQKFSLADFDAAIDEHVRGLSASTHARKEHLEPVLERINYTWSPEDPEEFVPEEEYDLPDDRDPRGKPAVLTDTEDMATAVAVELVERTLGTSQATRLDLGDAADVVGKPAYSSLKTAFARAEGQYSGIATRTTDSGTDCLAARPDELRSDANDELFSYLSETTDANTDDASDRDNWVDKVVSELMELPEDVRQRENVETTKIAEAKHPDPYDDRDHVTEEARNSVSDSDRERVRERLAEETADDDPTPEATDTPRAAATDERTDAVDEELNQITAAEHARGD